MRRRRFLTACGCGALATSTAGCLESLRREDAWRELVVDPPAGIYVPPKIDEMATYGLETADEYAVGVFATRPHSFWTVAGGEQSRADLRSDHAIHLMASVWDEETEVVLPTDIAASVRRNGDRIADRRLWPMLSQRMGFHYGENIALSENGTYVAELTIEPVRLERLGEFSDRFETAATLELEFEFSSEEIDSLERTLLDAEDGRGRAGALELMHGSHDGMHESHESHDDGTHEHHAHPPPPIAPAPSSLPGLYGGVAAGGDIEFAVAAGEGAAGGADTVGTAGADAVDAGVGDASAVAEQSETYLAVSPRTAYNRCILPFASISATVTRDGAEIASEDLAESIGPGLEHHYGTDVDIDAFRAGDEISISLETPPQLSRHEGYETAFFDLEDQRVRLAERNAR